MSITIASNMLQAVIKAEGAELCSLKTANEQELLWQADPKVWPRHAPLLFPIVGRLRDDQLIHQGHAYPLGQHGFARDMTFEPGEVTADSASFTLLSNETSRQKYPFEFELKVQYQLEENQLHIRYLLRNTDNQMLYASIGAHPGFLWPLNPGDNKEEYEILFEFEEQEPISQLRNGLIHQHCPSPLQGKRLALNDALFADDALIFTQHRSRYLRYQGPGPIAIEMHFADFPHLGIWTKPGAGFICLEPWQGHASDENEAEAFAEKRGIIALQPAEQRSWSHSIAVLEN